MKTGKEPRFNLSLLAICFVFTCGVILLVIIGNWPVYRNMQVLTNLKENKISELIAIENAAASAGHVVLLIENSAGSGSDIDLIEAEKQKKILLSQLMLAGRLNRNPQSAKDIQKLQALLDDIYKYGRGWVEAVIQMDLGSIAPMFKAFDQREKKYREILTRVQKTARQDLNATLMATVSSSKRSIVLTILISLVTIPLVIMLLLKLSVDNTKLYRSLKQTITEKSESLVVVEEQNLALSKAKIRDEITMARLKDEIAERIKTEEQLRSSESRISQIIDFLPDPTFVIDSESKVIAWNHAMEALSGVKAEAILGKGNFEYALPFYGERRPVMIDLVSNWSDAIAQKYRGVKQRGDVLVSETKDPPFRIGDSYYLNTAGPLRDASGRQIGAIETIRDITERRLTEQALRENEEVLRLYVANTPAAVAMCDRDMCYLTYSRRWVTDYKLPDEDLVGCCHYDVFGVIPEKWKQEHQRCFKGEVILNDEEQLIRADGSVDWVRRELHPWRTKDGNIGGLIMFTEVITPRKEAEQSSFESESRLQTIGDNLPGGMIYQVLAKADGTRKFTFVSAGVTKMYGYTPEQVLTDPMLLYNQIVEEDVDRLRTAEDKALREMSVFDVVTRMRLQSGEVRWHRLVSQPRWLEDGEIVFDGIDLDVTELKTIEEESRKRQMFIESVLYHAPDAIIILDATHKVLEWNPAAVRMFGYTPEEVIGIDLDDLVAPDQAHGEAAGKTQVVLSGQRLEAFETLRFRKDGTPLNVIAAGSPIMVGDTLAGVVAMYTDITELKNTESKIRQSRDMLELIIDTIPQFIFWKDLDSVYLGCNQNFARVAGVGSSAHIVGKTDYDLAWKREEADFFCECDARVMQADSAEYHIIEPQQQADGKKAFLDTNKVPIHDDQGKVIGILGTYEDITERMQADEELTRLRNLLANIIDSMPSVLVGVDTEGRVTQWNKQAEQITGLTSEQARTQPLVTVFPHLTDEMENIREAIVNHQVRSDAKKARHQESETRFEDITIYPLTANGVEGAVIRVDDVTERVRLEEMMIQSEKMLSVGGLAAGMAHEINNPLAGMMQTAQVLSLRLSDKIPANSEAAQACGITLEAIQCFMEARGVPKMLETIESSGRRAAAIVSNMLSFARKSDAAVSSHDLGDLLDRTIDLAAADYDLKKKYDFKQIEIKREYAAQMPKVPCESSKIQQVFLNILKNGAEAMAEVRGEDRPLRFVLRIERFGPWARIEIEDNGPGMDEAVCRRVFEPFYTTKPAGHGTGLGMSVSYFIITENHGGEMEATSSPGQGASFTIRLPLERS